MIAVLCVILNADSPINVGEALEAMNLYGDLSANQSENQSVATNSAKPSLDESNTDKNPNSHIKEWDKSKIIYEQVVDKIQILR